MSDTADRLAQRALAALDLGAPGPAAGPRRRESRQTAPLSFAQRRVWFLEELEPGLPVQNVARVVRLEGPLDEEAFARAVGAIVERHESLRTTLENESGEPRQRIHPPAAVPLEIDPLAGISGDREAAALSRAAHEARRPFDLERGPLARGVLIRISADRRLFVWTMHHVISDAASVPVFLRELAALYGALVSGERPCLPELPVQYGDFAEWQRRTMTDETLEGPLRRALRRLEGAPPVVELPTDRPRGARQTFTGGRLRRTLSSETGSELRAAARRHGMTLFMFLLAAFELLISRWTGSDDVVVGTPISGRKRLETENLIGLFVNMLVVRVDCSGDPTVSDFLARVRDEALDAFDRESLPFEKLVEAIRPERLLSHTPVFQLMFNFHGDLDAAPPFPGLQVSIEPIDNGAAPFDVTLTVGEDREGPIGLWSYNRDLFEAATVERMASHFENVLAGLAQGADRRLSAIELAGAAEREALRRLSAGPEPEAGDPATVAGLFADRLRRFPDSVAVSFGSERLTAAELDRESDRLAAALRAAGAGPERRVAVFLDRSVRLATALLAVVKSGAAFVPLDPSHPRERIDAIVADSGASLVMTDRAGEANDACPSLPAVLVDGPAVPGDDLRGGSAGPENAAYVLYTSGSTGRPKGVVVEHRSLVNLVRSMVREPGAKDSDVWLAVTPATFDIAIAEIFVPLASGAKLVVASREDSADPSALARLLRGSRATILQATPATWAMLVADGWEGKPDLKILSGGEALSGELARALRGRGRELWNLYGPTETTIWSAVGRVEDPGPGTVPIGRPIAGTSLHVVDPRLRLVPFGVAGELAIGGEGVARGYLGRPEETRERFVPNPFGPGRLYRTGDRVRRRADGAIDFLGRFDAQVKVRGVRVEPGEVEAALEDDPEVLGAVVVAAGEGAERRLAAFVRAGRRVAASSLRERLRRLLPEPMIPSEFVFVDAFPLTASGKVDRRALASRAPERRSTGEAPRTATETLVARTWAEILRVGEIGVDQNFFELGGHSLLATRILARLRSIFEVEIPLRVLFEQPTVAGLAGEIARRAEAAAAR